MYCTFSVNVINIITIKLLVNIKYTTIYFKIVGTMQ